MITATSSETASADRQRRHRRPAGARGEHGGRERADAHERALAERRQPGEPDAEREAGRGEREVEPGGELVDVHEAETEPGQHGERGHERHRRPLERAPGPARVAGALAQRGGRLRERAHSGVWHLRPCRAWRAAGARTRAGSPRATPGRSSGRRSRRSRSPPRRRRGRARRRTPGSGRRSRRRSAATRPFTPSSAPLETENGPLGAAATAITTAIAPTSANARFTYGSSGTPTIRAPSASCEIACSPRPKRVREISSDRPRREHDPERDHEQRPRLEGRAADRDDPVVPRPCGTGSGRGRRTPAG